MRVGDGVRRGGLGGRLAAGLCCWTLVASAAVHAQAPVVLVAAVQSAVSSAPPVTVDEAFPAGGPGGGLRLEAVRQTPVGPCRTFTVRNGAAARFIGEVCSTGSPPRWTISAIHPAAGAFIPEHPAVGIAHPLAPEALVHAPPAVVHMQPMPAPLPPPPPPVAADAQAVVAPPPLPAPAGDAPPPATAQPPAVAAQPPPAPVVAAPTQPGAAGTAADNQVKTLPILYNKPPQLWVDRDTSVSLVVASADLARASAALANFSGTAVQNSVPLTPQVTARLTGDPAAVTITARAAETQAVTNLGNVTWVWDVRAKTPGQTSLTLQVFDNLNVAGSAAPVQIAAYTDSFKADADPISWLLYELPRIEPIWKFLGLGTPVAILAGLFAWWTKRPRKARA